MLLAMMVSTEPTSERLQISIPRELLDSTENGKDIPFDVFINTYYNIIPDEIKTNNQSRTLSINITEETNVITIIGKKEKKTIDEEEKQKIVTEQPKEVCHAYPCDVVNGNKDKKTIDEEEKKQKIITEQPKEIKQISLNVFLDTHSYTLFDQKVSVRLYNSDGQFDSQYLTVPDTGGMTYSFNIDELTVPKGTVFTVCVTNERNDKEDCRTVNRAYGDDNIDVRMTVLNITLLQFLIILNNISS